MTIAASGAVSFSDLRTEFSGAGAISFSDLYRGGTLVKGNAGNNTATNLAASVPASGAINFTNFRSTARGWRKTFASNATNQNASTIFGSDYGVNYPKEIVINSGVTLGATSTSDEALEINTGGIGSITVTNNGTLIGAGGAAGANGGDAFEAFVSCTFVNNGFVYAGGGGGGGGGNGGNGSYSSSEYRKSFCSDYSETACYGPIFYWGGVYLGTGTRCWDHSGSITTGGATYSLSGGGTTPASNPCGSSWGYGITRTASATSTGGSGGSGGVGAGYNQSAAAGSGGANGGTNAGAGGNGGTGGGYGASGSNGNSGANGNSSNGAAGSGGAAGGKYIRGISFVTFTNNGTVAGGTA
jgi:hypothetical protein